MEITVLVFFSALLGLSCIGPIVISRMNGPVDNRINRVDRRRSIDRRKVAF
jgi:hypothetical protein